MRKVVVLLFVFLSAVAVSAQKDENKIDKTASAESRTNNFAELAKAAVSAHGGEKFRTMKTLVVRGTADVSGSPTQTFPATFAMVFSGDKYRYELSNPFQPFKQVYDGQQTVSSIPNFTLPPINRLGLPLLQRLDEKGYLVSALPEKSKKRNGFRVTSPEGWYTDFYVDEKSGQIKSYEASYDFNGRNVTTAVEIDKIRDIEGIKVPEKYAQRLELGFATIYVEFKAKEILVNSGVEDGVFSMAK